MQPTVTGFAARWLVATVAVLLLAAAPAAAQVCQSDPYQPRYRPPASEVIATAGISDTLPRIDTPGPRLHWWVLGAAPTPLLVLGSLLMCQRRRHHGVGDLPRSLTT
ncbi:MAG TPA: hypothetical protein VML75_08550 [Kofleriaceae bacterium]|nr:hypothetical protein [Kofleriaceae bacterium]